MNFTVVLKNKEDKEVVKYHVGKTIELLTTGNNSGFGSTMAARMFIDGVVVNQFIQPSDKIEDGKPSSKYNVLVYTSNNDTSKYSFVSEGEDDSHFVNNAYAGVVQFNAERSTSHKFAASVFEYFGSTMDKILDSSSSELDLHKSNDDIHVTKTQKDKWDNHVDNVETDSIHVTNADRLNWNSKINEVLPGDFISVTNKDTVSVKTKSTISDDNTTIPTSQVIYNHSKDINASDDTDSVHLTKK